MGSSEAPTGLLGKIRSEIRDIVDRHMKEDAFGEDGIAPHPFAGLDKAAVLQECRVFHDANFVKMHPKRCCQQITKLLYFLTQGDTFNGTDSMEVFFGVTKLFQSSDGNLRRMVYLFLKEVAAGTDPSNLLIVVQSLVKDMFHDIPLYRGNAIRVLSRIVDEKMLGQVERYYKQALVDRDDHVSAAALSSSYFLLMSRAGCGDVIARWSGEVQAVLTSAGGKGDMVAFHALVLLRSLKRHDRLAVSKVVQTLARSGMRSPLGLCLLIRYSASQLITPDSPAATALGALEFLEGSLRHKSEMVMYEAARALVSLPVNAAGGALASRDMSLPITVLHMFLSSPKPALRFAAVRTLNRLATSLPAAVARCNDDLEALITDANKAIGTLAITTLLKTGSEANVERLTKQIGAFMGDVGSDELKVVVVTAVHELALRVPTKHRPIQVFLSNALRDEGGYDFKKAVLDALLDMMEVIPESKTDGLFHCCEFIEDCEFTALATRVLNLLGREGPALPAPQPAAFIRFIYNRVILENAPVRASAVSALAKFASACEDLQPQIIPLLQRCTDDDDDEVRDRASLYLHLLGQAAPGSSSSEGGSRAASVPPAEATVTRALNSGLIPMPVSSLSKALQLYQLRPSAGAFSFSALPHVEAPGGAAHPAESGGGYGYVSETRASEAAAASAKIARARDRLATSNAAAAASTASEAAAAGSASASAGGGAGSGDSAAEALYRIAEFSSFGPLFRSSRVVELMEKELEYLVAVQKHVFANHLVFGFTITNTVPEVLLERVTIAMAPSEGSGYTPCVTIGIPRIREGVPGHVYVAFARSPEAGFGAVSFSTEMRFASRECDPSANYEPVGEATKETYPVDDVEVGPADYVAPALVADFRAAWDAAGAECEEVQDSFGLSFKSVPEAVAAVIETLGLTPQEGTGAVKPTATKHAAFLAGTFLGDTPVLGRMLLALDEADAGGAPSGCTLRIALRCANKGVSELLIAALS